MEGGARSCPTGHGRALASIRIQTVLGDALQNAKTSRRWSEDLQGGPCVDLPDGDGESELGCTANPWRIPDARIRGIGNNHLPLDETSTQEPRTGQPLGAFLRNHREAIVAMDFFTVPTLTFNLLYCFFLISHDRRCILHSNVTQHPTSSWIVQQLREAFPYQSTPKFLILDHDAKYGLEVPAAIRSMNMGCVRTSIQSPWQNGIAERWVSSCRRELLDQIIPLNERHLKRLLREFISYYHDDRTHLGLHKQTPGSRAHSVGCGPVISRRRLGGLHHRYDRAA
jgi:transposase InsO family protein